MSRTINMSQSSVSLPSIHEMLPGYIHPTSRSPSFLTSGAVSTHLDRDPRGLRQRALTTGHVQGHHAHQTMLSSIPRRHSGSSSGALINPPRPPNRSPNLPRPTDDTPRISHPISRPPVAPKPDGFFHTYSYTHTPSALSSQAVVQPEVNDPPTHSFDVLRSDPHTASLEHITSSTTFLGRSGSAMQGRSSAGVANGSIPAFRVRIAPSAQPSSDQRSEGGLRGRDDHDKIIDVDVNGRTITDHPASDTELFSGTGQPAIISFPVSGSVESLSPYNGNARESVLLSSGRKSRGDNRGRKHQCPHCLKRFNRPSSLKIHVNTHTGAKPFQCPYPSCGREFNVNSNMRRHYRAHVLSRGSRHQPASGDGDEQQQPPHTESSGDQSSGSTPLSSPDQYGTMSLALTPSSAGSPDGGSERDELEMENSMDDDADDADEEDELWDDDGMQDEHRTRSPLSGPHRPGAFYEVPPQQRRADGREINREESRSYGRIAVQRPIDVRHPQSQSPRQTYMYSPSSAAFDTSYADATVSTALRPAFARQHTLGSPMRIKEED